MAIKHANILDRDAIAKTAKKMDVRSMTPKRDKLMLALSTKSGLRAKEIAKVYFEDILDLSERLRDDLFVSSRAAKYGKARPIPMHPELRSMLAEWVMLHADKSGPLLYTRFGDPMTANAVAQLLKRAFERAELRGCSSHSGRRSFITNLARNCHKVGQSLRDVQILAGHASLRTTELYIEPPHNSAALVALA